MSKLIKATHINFPEENDYNCWSLCFGTKSRCEIFSGATSFSVQLRTEKFYFLTALEMYNARVHLVFKENLAGENLFFQKELPNILLCLLLEVKIRDATHCCRETLPFINAASTWCRNMWRTATSSQPCVLQRED